MSCNQKADCPAGQYCCSTLMFDPDASTRRAQGSYCHTPPASNCLGVQICLQDTDCLAATCNKNTNLFTPPGIIGECVVGMGSQ